MERPCSTDELVQQDSLQRAQAATGRISSVCRLSAALAQFHWPGSQALPTRSGVMVATAENSTGREHSLHIGCTRVADTPSPSAPCTPSPLAGASRRPAPGLVSPSGWVSLSLNCYHSSKHDNSPLESVGLPWFWCITQRETHTAVRPLSHSCSQLPPKRSRGCQKVGAAALSVPRCWDPAVLSSVLPGFFSHPHLQSQGVL